MAWVTMVSKAGTRLKVPKTVYENMYQMNEAYSVLQESKPTPKFEKKEEVVKNDNLQVNDRNEVNTSSKGSKKAIS